MVQDADCRLPIYPAARNATMVSKTTVSMVVVNEAGSLEVCLLARGVAGRFD